MRKDLIHGPTRKQRVGSERQRIFTIRRIITSSVFQTEQLLPCPSARIWHKAISRYPRMMPMRQSTRTKSTCSANIVLRDRDSSGLEMSFR
jgi:hypothetical protein